MIKVLVYYASILLLSGVGIMAASYPKNLPDHFFWIAFLSVGLKVILMVLSLGVKQVRDSVVHPVADVFIALPAVYQLYMTGVQSGLVEVILNPVLLGVIFSGCFIFYYWMLSYQGHKQI
jgi:hypothetical protein